MSASAGSMHESNPFVGGQSVAPPGSSTRPHYVVSSVDNALHLIQLIARDGCVRVSEAAAELNVAKSTAHRLLAMLCYWGFARKDGDRLYRGGPALVNIRPGPWRQADLCAVARPFLEGLHQEFDETVHLVVLQSGSVEFVASLEGGRSLRVGSRVGAVMAAHRTSGGQALLAALSTSELQEQFPEGSPDPNITWDEFLHSLAAVQRRGYGINHGLTERGVVAIGACVRNPQGRSIAALCLSAPALRLNRRQIPQAAAILRHYITKFEAELVRLSRDTVPVESGRTTKESTWQ